SSPGMTPEGIPSSSANPRPPGRSPPARRPATPALRKRSGTTGNKRKRRDAAPLSTPLPSPDQFRHDPRLLFRDERLGHASAAVDQFLRIEAEEMQQSRVVVVMVDHVLDRVVAELVGGPV